MVDRKSAMIMQGRTLHIKPMLLHMSKSNTIMIDAVSAAAYGSMLLDRQGEQPAEEGLDGGGRTTAAWTEAAPYYSRSVI